MAKLKALQTLHGAYGMASTGDIIELSDRAAKQLVDNGLAEYVEDETEADKSEQKVNEKIEADAKSEKPSIKVGDNTNKEKKTILKP